jgi:hypothetical protein
MESLVAIIISPARVKQSPTMFVAATICSQFVPSAEILTMPRRPSKHEALDL